MAIKSAQTTTRSEDRLLHLRRHNVLAYPWYFILFFFDFFHPSSRYASWMCLSKETPIYLSTEKNYHFVSLARALRDFIVILFSVNFDIITYLKRMAVRSEETQKERTQPKKKGKSSQ